MTSYVEFDTPINPNFSFDVHQIVCMVMEQVLDTEQCPYEASVNVLLTDDDGIRAFNAKHRDIDTPTDVLSFPNIFYDTPGDFTQVEASEFDCFDPDSGELLLGDIIISVEKVKSQAVLYGHSEKREFAFLVAHSMLHLCGYDHMTEEDAHIMENKQDMILNALGITRDSLN